MAIDSTPFIVVGILGGAVIGYILYTAFAHKLFKTKSVEGELQEEIPRDRQPLIEFDGENIIGSFKNAIGQHFSGRVIKRSVIHDRQVFWIADDKARKTLKLTDMVMGVNVKLHPASDVCGGRVKLITNRDARDEQCDWATSGIERLKEQFDATYLEKGRQQTEEYARKLKESQNRLRSPYELSEEEKQALAGKRMLRGEDND